MDAVVIASPDHQHAPMLFAALAAGKDVYLEKPLSKSLEESVKIVDTVRKSKQIVQVGMQRRSAESLIKAKALVDDGILGQITLVKPQWHWNIAKELDNSPLTRKARLGSLPGQREKAPAGADALPALALFLGLCRRQHDRSGYAPDGRSPVVQQAVDSGVSHLPRLRREDERAPSIRTSSAPSSSSRT